jgi:hypothetical protein
MISQALVTDSQVSPHDQYRQAEPDSHGDATHDDPCSERQPRRGAGPQPQPEDPETAQPIQPATNGAAAALHHLSGEAMRMLGTSHFLSGYRITDARSA